MYTKSSMVYNFPRHLKPRMILKHIAPFLNEEEILLLYGMRQTGKTSLLFLLRNHLLNTRKTDERQMVYFDLEDIGQLNEIERLQRYDEFLTLLKDKYKISLKKRVFVFIDEIQHLRNPSSLLKYLYDHYKPKLKFIVSGSSSLEIRKKFSDALTGRVLRFEILPLSYQEFLSFSGERKSAVSFEEFMTYGGFPAIALKKTHEAKRKLLKEIHSLYIRRDIKDIGGIEDILAFNKLVGVLAAQNGGLISEVNLSNAVDLARPTVKHYLFLLQNTFVIDLLPPFFTNPKKELTKTPKLYFHDQGLRNAVLDNFSSAGKRPDRGILAENVIFAELKKYGCERIAFWRTERKQEVDFVIKQGVSLIPLEIKYGLMNRAVIPEGLTAFISKYRPPNAYVITSNLTHTAFYQGTRVTFLPGHRLGKDLINVCGVL